MTGIGAWSEVSVIVVIKTDGLISKREEVSRYAAHRIPTVRWGGRSLINPEEADVHVVVVTVAVVGCGADCCADCHNDITCSMPSLRHHPPSACRMGEPSGK